MYLTIEQANKLNSELLATCTTDWTVPSMTSTETLDPREASY